jgi:hypothetical protein
MDDADLQQAVQEDLRWKPRLDAAQGAPSAGFLHIVVGYDGSAPAGRALDAAVRLLQGRVGCVDVVWVAHLSSTVRLSADAMVEVEAAFDELAPELRAQIRRMRTVTPRSFGSFKFSERSVVSPARPGSPVEVLLVGHSLGGGVCVGVVEGGERLVSSDGQLERSA